MRFTASVLAGLLLFGAASAAWALTADEVIKLKNAGVSDATIQKMLEQEQVQSQSPVRQQGDEVVYSAGGNTAKDAAENEAHERWKERKSMDVLQGTVIDLRNQQPGTVPADQK